MKSAVLMSGHFRSFEMSFKEFKNILPESDFYAFLLANNNSYENEKNGSSEIQIEKIKNENNFYHTFTEDESIDMNEYQICNNLLLHFSIPNKTKFEITEKWLRQVNDYKKSFEWLDSYGKQYDIVYRIRPDLTIKKIDMSLHDKIKNNSFNCFQQNSYQNQINDKFFYGSYETMKKFMIGMIESLKDKNITKVTSSGFNVEQYLYRYLKYLNYDINLLSKDKFFMKKISKGQELCAGFQK
jgi:hypothetical protein